jgi:tetratricopeptide (TPR) repeat protein
MMKKWLLLLIVTVILTSVLSAITIKVAVLPLKRLDSPSKYIQNIMTIRDLQHTFNTSDKFELLDMKATANALKEMAIDDIDDMEKADMAEIGKTLNADVVVLGTISAIGDNLFDINFRFYSMRTDEIKNQRVDVVKEKKKRWATLEKDFLGRLSTFITEELDKMNTLAIQDYTAENYTQAEKEFNTVLSYNPENIQSYYYLGMIAYQNKDYAKAITDLNKSLPDTLTAKDSKSLQGLSDVYKDMGNTDMMLNTLVKLANLQQDAELWLSIANLYVENKQNAKAREALENSLRVDPEFKNSKIRMAFLLYDMAEYGDAIPYLEFAANDNPDNDMIGRRLAFSYQKAGRIDEAISRYQNSIQNNPTNIGAYLNLAGLYRTVATDAAEAKNEARVAEYNQKAIDILTRAKAIDAENAYVYLRFADVYLAANNMTEAETNATLAIAKDYSLYQPYVLRATVYQRLGTDKYNQFIDLEKKAAAAYGNTASRLSKERDAARLAANTYFNKAQDDLKAARNRTSETEILSDINNKLDTVAQLIAQTSKVY